MEMDTFGPHRHFEHFEVKGSSVDYGALRSTNALDLRVNVHTNERIQCSYLTRRKADMVITDEPTTNNASAERTSDMHKSTRCFGTLSPKKTTCNTRLKSSQDPLSK